jgi:mRNA interferase YafQ
MRIIKYTSQFKRDYKREKRGQHKVILDDKLLTVVRLLTIDKPLPELMHDHPLAGNLKDCRDCHIRPDLVLIYRKNNNDILELVRLGSHSELSI